MKTEPYKFCFTCGALLIVKKRVWSYNENTGIPRTTYDYGCPKRTVWQNFLDSHPCTESESYMLQG
jgi:hypothetical protein